MDRDEERKAGKAMTVGSSIFGVLFILVWCGIAISMGAWFMALFGIPMLGFAVYRLVVVLRLAKEEEKKSPEADPWDRPAETPRREAGEGKFCPYCGGGLQEEFAFCPRCGRRL